MLGIVDRPPFLDVTVHRSVYPAAVIDELRDGLSAGVVPTRQLYLSARQARLWRAIAAAFSPARDAQDGVQVYDQVNARAAQLLGSNGVHVIGLGCGDGAKEQRLLEALAGCGPLTATPVDVSLPLVLTAADALADSAEVTRPIVCDLASCAGELAEMIGPSESPRLVTLYGILPGLEAAPALAAAQAILRPGDLLAVSANLLPDHPGALERIIAQYDNPPTRRWLSALLEEAGIEQDCASLRIEALDDPGPGARAGVGGWLEVSRPVEVPFGSRSARLEPGRPVRLLRSVRHDADGLTRLIADVGLEVLDTAVSPSGEEGVVLAAA